MSWNLKSCGREGKRYLYLWDPELKKKVYVGRGVDAERKDRERTEARISQQQAFARQGARLDRLATAGALVGELFDVTQALLRATLMVAGYRLHARSEWRKRRRTHGCDAE